jgi:hypothetical protein
MRSLARLNVLEDMIDRLFDVARHLGVGSGVLVEAVEFMRLE